MVKDIEMLNIIPLPKIFLVNCYQTPDEASCPWGWKTSIMTINVRKIEKNPSFGKIHEVKMFQTISLPLETMQ